MPFAICQCLQKKYTRRICHVHNNHRKTLSRAGESLQRLLHSRLQRKDAVRTACKACAGKAVRLRRHSGLSHHRIRRQLRLQGPPRGGRRAGRRLLHRAPRQRLSGTAQRRTDLLPPRQHALEGAGGGNRGKAERRLHGAGHVPEPRAERDGRVRRRGLRRDSRAVPGAALFPFLWKSTSTTTSRRRGI